MAAKVDHSREKEVANATAAEVEVTMSSSKHFTLKVNQESTDAFFALVFDASPQRVVAFEDVHPLLLDVAIGDFGVRWQTIGQQCVQCSV